MALRVLLVDAAARRHGRRLLRGLAHRFLGRRFAVPALVPETLADGFFLASGFSRAVIAQLEQAKVNFAAENPLPPEVIQKSDTL